MKLLLCLAKDEGKKYWRNIFIKEFCQINGYHYQYTSLSEKHWKTLRTTSGVFIFTPINFYEKTKNILQTIKQSLLENWPVGIKRSASEPKGNNVGRTKFFGYFSHKYHFSKELSPVPREKWQWRQLSRGLFWNFTNY